MLVFYDYLLFTVSARKLQNDFLLNQSLKMASHYLLHCPDIWVPVSRMKSTAFFQLVGESALWQRLESSAVSPRQMSQVIKGILINKYKTPRLHNALLSLLLSRLQEEDIVPSRRLTKTYLLLVFLQMQIRSRQST